jgi:hypothetical protein
MSSFSLSPAVTVQEIDATSYIPAVSTSTGAFAGTFQWGPVLQIVNCASPSDLLTNFYQPNNNTAVSYFTAENYLQYSANLNVVRNVGAGALNATESGTGVLISNLNTYTNSYSNNVTTWGGFAAKYPGALGNALRVSLCDNKNFKQTLTGTISAFPAVTLTGTITTNSATTALTGSGTNFTGQLTAGATVSYNGVVLGTIASVTNATAAVLTGNASSTQAGVTATTSGSVNVIGASTAFTTQCSVGSIISDSSGNVVGRIGTISSNNAIILTTIAAYAETSATNCVVAWEFASLFSGAPATSPYVANEGGSLDEVHVVVQDTLGLFSPAPGTILKTYAFLSVASDALNSSGSSNYYKTVINRSDLYVWHMAHPTSGTNWGNTGANTTYASLTSIPSYQFAGGVSNDVLTDAIAEAGYNMFANADIVDVSLIPLGGASPTVANYVISNITTVRMDCMAFVSPQMTDVVQNVGFECASVIATRNLLPATSYAVMDSGWKYQYDRYNDVYRWIPLNGDIAGLCAQTSATNNDWWSPAGYNRGQIKNCVKLAYSPNINDRNLLFPLGINPVITQKAQGTFLFGDKTLLSRPSVFDAIGVRRLFILLEKSIATAAKYQLFEFNDAPTRANFLGAVNPFLRIVQGGRGIVVFSAVCDKTNNTPAVINSNQFVASIFIQPNLSIRGITLSFVATPAGVAFTEFVSDL